MGCRVVLLFGYTGDMKSPRSTAATALIAIIRSPGPAPAGVVVVRRRPTALLRPARESRVLRRAPQHAARPDRLRRAADARPSGRALPAVRGGHRGLPRAPARSCTTPSSRSCSRRSSRSCSRTRSRMPAVPHFALAAAAGIVGDLALRDGAAGPNVRHLPRARAWWYSRRCSCCTRRCGRSCGPRRIRTAGGDDSSGQATHRHGGVRSASADVAALRVGRDRSALSELRGAGRRRDVVSKRDDRRGADRLGDAGTDQWHRRRSGRGCPPCTTIHRTCSPRSAPPIATK